MAVFRYNRYLPGQGADTNSYFSQWYSNLTSFNTLSDTSWTGGFIIGERAAMIGSGLEYTMAAGPLRTSDGTITKLTLTHLGFQIMSVTGLKLDATTWGTELLSGFSDMVEFVHKGNDSIFGSIEADTLYGYNGRDVIRGGDDYDNLYGGNGADTLLGQAVNDTVYGDDGNDRLIGGDGDDYHYGGDGADTAIGGIGDDNMSGGAQNDVLSGGAGDDNIYGDDGRDRLSGGSEDDELYGGTGQDTMSGGTAEDAIFGESENDQVNGDTGNDFVYGGSGNDKLFGGAGQDYLSGDPEADVIRGGTGIDTIYGGTGADQFVFDTALGVTNVDDVEDFEINIDKIVLDNDIFTAAGPVGALAASRFVVGTGAGDAGDRIIYDSMSGRLYYDKDGTGGAAKVWFATLDSALALDAADFTLIN